MKLINLNNALSLDFENWGKYYKNYYNSGLYNIFKILGTSDMDVKEAEGLEIKLKDGRIILDFSSAIGILALGHNHKRIIQAEKKCHELKMIDAIKVAPHKLQGILAYNIAEFLPGPLDISFFAISGAEAVEGALKLCEKLQGPNKKKIISASNSYHGKTHGALSLTNSGGFKDNYIMGIPENNIIVVNHGDIDQLENELIKNNDSVMATIIEPIQGQSINVPQEGYLSKVVELCHKHDVLVIFDEIKSGMGRTGKFCYFQYEDVVPDIVTLSKALGGGKRAICAFVTSKKLFKKAYGKKKDAGLHSTTFGGLGESCAVAIETLNVIAEENLVSMAESKGKYFIDKLYQLQTKYPDSISEIRGRGLLLGIRFNYDKVLVRRIINNLDLKFIKTIDSIFIASIVSTLYRDHNIIVHFSNSDLDILHIMPPLIISYDEIDKFIYALDKILQSGFTRNLSSFVKANVI